MNRKIVEREPVRFWPSADLLVARARRAVSATSNLRIASSAPVLPPRHEDLEDAAHSIHVAYNGVIPPVLAPVRGLAHRANRIAKRFVRKATFWYVEPRWEAQREVNASAARFATQALLTAKRLQGQLDDAERQSAQLMSSQARLTRTMAALESEIEALRVKERALADELRSMVQVGDRVSGLASTVARLSDQLPALFERVGVSSASGLDFNYVDFENRFRGSSDQTSQLQLQYVDQFPDPTDAGRIVDIGCGRGEMVALLAAAGHQAVGVDSDADMILICRQRGLNVEEANGISWLESQPNWSLKGIFCSQVVEHFVTPELERFVMASFAALRPDGILIIETINPRSLFALANHFFADLSHVRPIHPETLRFMCEQAGFSQSLLEERSPHEAMAALAGLAEDSDSAVVRELVNTVFGFQDYSLKVIK